MCYSAGASFIASGGLAVVGTMALRESKNNKQRLIAIIPLIFALQQAIEGYQWLSLGVGQSSVLAGYGFLFFAFLFWPIYIPSTVFALDKKRRYILGWLVGIGIGVAIFLLWFLMTEPLYVYIREHSICYDINVSLPKTIISFYVLVTCGAFLLSSKPVFNWFGFIFLTSAIISAIFFFYAFTSVWCLYAAILSSFLYLYIKYPNLGK